MSDLPEHVLSALIHQFYGVHPTENLINESSGQIGNESSVVASSGTTVATTTPVAMTTSAGTYNCTDNVTFASTTLE